MSLAWETLCDFALACPGRELPRMRCVREIARGAGVYGMVAGQSMDLYSEREKLMDAGMLEYIHLNKTARMLISPLRGAARLAGLGDEDPRMKALTDFGRSFGLLFQVTDDILDVTADPALLGKSMGKDAQAGKLTYVTLLGLDGATARAEELEQQALAALEPFGEKAAFFRSLTGTMAERRG